MKIFWATVLGFIFLPVKLLGLVLRVAQAQFLAGADKTDDFIRWINSR